MNRSPHHSDTEHVPLRKRKAIVISAASGSGTAVAGVPHPETTGALTVRADKPPSSRVPPLLLEGMAETVEGSDKEVGTVTLFQSRPQPLILRLSHSAEQLKETISLLQEAEETISRLQETEGKLRAEVESLKEDIAACRLSGERREAELTKTVEELELKLREQLASLEEEKRKSYEKSILKTIDRFKIEFGNQQY